MPYEGELSETVGHHRRRGATGGFFSAHNEREAEEMGVKKVALPARGRLSKKCGERQKQRWFRRLLKWRAGSESLEASLLHGASDLQRGVGIPVLWGWVRD
jgi:hypothetical protein